MAPIKCDKCQAAFSLTQALCIHEIWVHGDLISHSENCTCDACKVKDIKIESSMSFTEDNIDIHSMSFVEDNIDFHNDIKNIVTSDIQAEDRTKKAEAKGLTLNTEEAAFVIYYHETKASLAQMIMMPRGKRQILPSMAAKYDKLFMSAKVVCERLPDSHDSLNTKEVVDTEDAPEDAMENPDANTPGATEASDSDDDQKTYKCEICKKTLSSADYLKRHIKNVHLGLQPDKCDICNKQFGGKGWLKVHTRTVHESIKPFKCEFCNKQFGQGIHCKTHLNTVHKGIKTFKCKSCSKCFGHRSHLKRHISSVHEGLRPFKCKICSQTFAQNSHLKVHNSNVHGSVRGFES